jgi:cyclophilin family peptidyl-prolyl cis-trans isomerase
MGKKKKTSNKLNHAALLFCFLSLLILAACNTEPEIPPSANHFDQPGMIDLMELIDKRQTDQIIPYLSSKNSKLKALATKGCGSLQDSVLISPLTLVLIDSLPEIRRDAAFALGQIRNNAAFDALFEQLNKETDTRTKSEIWIALGKTASASDVDTLIKSVGNAPCNENAAWALYQLTLKNLLESNRVADNFFFLLDCPSPDARLAFAQFLARSINLDLSPFTNQLIERYEKEDTPETKIALAMAFRHCGNIHSNDLLRLISISGDERIQQNLLRAGWSTGALLPRDMVELLQNHHPLITYSCADWMAQQPWSAELTHEMELILDVLAKEVKPIVLKGLVINSKEKSKFVDLIVEQIGLNEGQPFLQGDYIRALEGDEEAVSYIVAHMDTSLPAPLSTASAETILNMHRQNNWPTRIDFSVVAQEAFSTDDEAILALFGAYLREAEMVDFAHPEWLEEAMNKLTLPRQIETYNELLQSIQFIRGEELVPHELLYSHPINWDLIKTIHKDQQVKIETPHGEIILQLLVEEAPGSVGSFVELINADYYDGKYVHRVVPNFVIQSGCPRGDGYGSVDYAIRSEFTPRAYSTGSVGMASAGKDTESCQWFITHSPTPHLQGRYTQFAFVVKGMDVMRKVQQGDLINSISLISSDSNGSAQAK